MFGAVPYGIEVAHVGPPRKRALLGIRSLDEAVVVQKSVPIATLGPKMVGYRGEHQLHGVMKKQDPLCEGHWVIASTTGRLRCLEDLHSSCFAQFLP